MRVTLLRRALLVAVATLATSGLVAAQNTYTSSPGAAIPDNAPGAGLTDVITVPGSDTGNATDVNVDLSITHSWVGDLFVTVTHPLGPVSTIIDRPGRAATGFGCSGDDINALFDDASAVPAEDNCLSPGGLNAGPYSPFSPLSVFNGAAAVGNWTITVEDNAGGDTGTLNSWSLIIDGLIPVELVSFDAVANGTSVNLAWETASETNNAGFEVQMDRGTGFEALAFVAGNGTTTEAQTYSHTATNLAPGAYTFRLKQIDFDGAFEYSDEVEATIEVVGTHVLTDAYPNPFNPQATFSFTAAQSQAVTATLYNSLGQRVAVLFDGSVEADQAQTVAINGAGLASGLYVVRVEGERFTDALRVTLLK